MKLIAKSLLCIIALPLLYIIGSLITSYIVVNKDIEHNTETPHRVYLHSNGVHLDIALNKDDMPSTYFKGLYKEPQTQYISFGWGEENFYLNTPEWKDLTVKNAFNALFLESPSLMHVTKYSKMQKDWIAIEVSSSSYNQLLEELEKTFQLNQHGQVIMLPGVSYTQQDEFYKANGSYHLFNTCNTWVNNIFKNSNIKACLWTPFDFALMQHHQD